MGWIDCKKAYDTVPHSWIIESTELHKIDHKIINLVQQSMGSWNTVLTSGDKHLGNIKIKRGIVQGDALSPLLFSVATNPLSYILRDAKQAYTLKTGHKVNHLLYMDDLKLYAKNEKDLTTLIEKVRILTRDICMEFGLEKCARQIIQRENTKITDGLNLDIGIIIRFDACKDRKFDRWSRTQASRHNSQGVVDGRVSEAGVSTATPDRSAVLCG